MACIATCNGFFVLQHALVYRVTIHIKVHIAGMDGCMMDRCMMN